MAITLGFSGETLQAALQNALRHALENLDEQDIAQVLIENKTHLIRVENIMDHPYEIARGELD